MAGARPLDDLIAIMRRLRDPDTGCEWDRVQTSRSIAPYAIEEAYELFDAIASDDDLAMRDELGDLLLQVVFHSQMASERQAFDIDDVIAAICVKMERRHPHIFGDANERVDWESLKDQERGLQGAKSALDGVARALPSLQRAQKIQKRAARVGFDWPDIMGVEAKIEEELDEVREATSPEEKHDEIGDLLFAVVNLARHMNIDAERALDDATAKFEARFRQMESEGDTPFANQSMEELDARWRRAKIAVQSAS